MGGALLEGWHQQRNSLCSGDWAQSVSVVEHQPARRTELSDHYGVSPSASLKGLSLNHPPALILLAVKPTHLAQTLLDIQAHPGLHGGLIVSIAAGKSLSFYEGVVGASRPIVRTMPNLPATVGKGSTFCIANAATSALQKQLITRCFEAVGQCHWVEQEDALHALTAIYGSGPAYLFYFMEVMERVAVTFGVDSAIIRPALIQLFTGSSALAAMPESEPQTLRQNVTSPRGTTEAGLRILMDKDNGLERLIHDTIAQAEARSRSLSNAE